MTRDPINTIRAAVRHPAFWGILALKIAASSLLGGEVLQRFFVPFVNQFVHGGFTNPWDYFYALGMPKAFPYAPLMLYILAIPRLLLAPLLASADPFMVTWLHLLATRLPLLIADLGLYLILSVWAGANARRVLWLYWCSPVVFFINYYHGQLDIIPTALFTAALFATFRRRYAVSAVLAGLGLATKAHLWIAMPFLILYWLRQRVGWRRVAGYTAMIAGLYGLFVFPYLRSPAYLHMVVGAEEQWQILALAIPRYSERLAFLLCPAVLFLLVMKFASYPKVNRDILLFFLGITFAAFVILVPPMPGWFLWSLPLIVFYFATQRHESTAPYWVFSACYLMFFLYRQDSDLFQAWGLVAPFARTWPSPQAWVEHRWPAAQPLLNVLFTLLETSLIVISYWMYRTGIKRNEQYRLRLRPILVGIGGDSGAGKDFAREALERVLGTEQIIGLNGDDHHKWPRGHENWQVYTHLNPAGNDLRGQHQHAVALKDGRAILRVTYDHTTGTFSDPKAMDPNQYVIFCGLHPFFQQQMRNLFDLKIFLDPDESLRTYWKVRRDVQDRGYAVEAVLRQLQQRRPDSDRYIKPQREHADLIVQFRPAAPIRLDHLAAPVPLALTLTFRNGANLTELLRALQGVRTLDVQYRSDHVSGDQHLNMQGTITAEQVRQVAGHAIPGLSELVADHAVWLDGMNGTFQVVALQLLSDVLQRGSV